MRQLVLAFVTLIAASVYGSSSYAQSGPFAGMAGNWSGGGTVMLDDGSSERIRCRASYAVGAGGTGLNLTLTCASDSYKFDLKGNVISDRGVLSLPGPGAKAAGASTAPSKGAGPMANFRLSRAPPVSPPTFH
jgi:hypothetical protein